MARYWVGGTGSWDNTAATKWATTSGGGGGAAVPTAADDVFFDAASGAAVITLTSAGVCRSLNCTGFTGSFVQAAAINLSIGDATAGASNVALLFVAGMTYTRNAGAIILFVSTSATQQTITTGGKTGFSVTFSGVGSSYIFQDTWVNASNITHSNGIVNTNNQTLSLTTYAMSGSAARTLTMGSSAITLTGTGSAFTSSSAGGLTITANTATMTLTGTAAIFNHNASSSINYNGLSVVFSGSGIATLGGAQPTVTGTFANVTRTGTAVKTDSFAIGLGTIVITGTLTVTGNSTVNRMLMSTNVTGTAYTVNTASAPILTNVDFTDITATGTGGTWTGTSMGNALGNTNITFDAPVTQTHTASAGGNWSDSTKWTSRVPLPQDDVVVDVSTTGTLTADMPRMGKSVNFTGFAGTASLTTAVSVFGNLTLAAGMSLTGVQPVTLTGRSSHTVTSAGRTFPGTVGVSSPGGTYTLQDSFITVSTLNITAGTFDTTTNVSVTCNIFQTSGTLTKVINSGTGIWFINSLVNVNGNVWLTPSGAGTTINGSPTITIATASTSTRNFAGGNFTFGTLTYTVANSPGPLTITGANTFSNLSIGSGRVLTMPSSTVNTFTTFNVNGTNNGYLYIPGVAANYANTPDSAALSVTGNIDIRCRVAFDNWLPAVQLDMITKYSPTGANKSYRLFIDSAGRPQLNISSDGTTLSAVSSGTPTGFAAASLNWVRVTWRASDGQVKFYTASGAIANPVTADWTQQGSTGTLNIGAIADTAIDLEIGSSTTGAGVNSSGGKFYRAQIRNNVLDDGSGIVFDADFTTKAFGANSFAESSSNAATVTINGTTAQAGDGRVLLDSSVAGTAATISKVSGSTSVDYLTIKDSAAAGGATWFAGANSVNVSGNTGWVFSAPPGGSPNLMMMGVG